VVGSDARGASAANTEEEDATGGETPEASALDEGTAAALSEPVYDLGPWIENMYAPATAYTVRSVQDEIADRKLQKIAKDDDLDLDQLQEDLVHGGILNKTPFIELVTGNDAHGRFAPGRDSEARHQHAPRWIPSGCTVWLVSTTVSFNSARIASLRGSVTVMEKGSGAGTEMMRPSSSTKCCAKHRRGCGYHRVAPGILGIGLAR